MIKGKKVTQRFDKRINIRFTSDDWHLIIFHAHKDRQTPSAWVRAKLGVILNGLREKH